MKQNHRAIRPVRSLLAAALAIAALPAAAQTYSQTVFFGDSLTDSGWFRPALVQAAGPQAAILGRFTTNPNLVWSEHLAGYYGTNATAANQGGSNYAVGGATTGTNTSGALGPIPSLRTQITGYLTANGGHADSRALYTVWGGANDLFAIAGGAPAQATMAAAIGAQVGNVALLSGAGAKYILVPTVPDLGLTPSFLAQGPVGSAGGTQLATTYNTTLFSTLAAQNLRVIPLDTFTLIREIVASPSAYGFTNVTGTACTGSAVTCSPANWTAANITGFAFADGVHPSGPAHLILGQYAISILEAPRQMALLPYTETLTGKIRADAVSSQLSIKPEGDGMRWWADVRGNSQRFESLHYDGGGPALLFGLDWTSGDFTYGGFAGYSQQDFDFGQRRGEFDQDDATLGGYIAWASDDLWANAQLSWTNSSYDVDRRVTLGPAVRSYEGSPDGENLAFGANAGWNFHHGALTHGPVVSLLVQQIDVDAFAENRVDSAGLAYPDQDFDSTIGSLGWQASYTIKEHVAPYARLSWEKEFEDAPEEAFARSLSIPGALPYAVPGLEHDENYGTFALGLRTQVFGVDTDIGATGSVGQEGGDYASVFVTFGKRF